MEQMILSQKPKMRKYLNANGESCFKDEKTVLKEKVLNDEQGTATLTAVFDERCNMSTVKSQLKPAGQERGQDIGLGKKGKLSEFSGFWSGDPGKEFLRGILAQELLGLMTNWSPVGTVEEGKD